MEIKDFISNTIEQISLGIVEASEKCEKHDVIINPNITFGGKGDYYIPEVTVTTGMQRRVQIIDMDIAVSVVESEGEKLEGKLGIPILGVGANTQESKSTSNENRVKFSIPVCLPVTDVLDL